MHFMDLKTLKHRQPLNLKLMEENDRQSFTVHTDEFIPLMMNNNVSNVTDEKLYMHSHQAINIFIIINKNRVWIWSFELNC